jgi:hypothetical protein
MVQVSDDVMRGMGFSLDSSNPKLSARFHSLNLYELRGYVFPEKPVCVRNGTVGETTFAFAIGYLANELSRELVADNLFPDEQAWRDERKAEPPYVLVHLGPTAEYMGTSEWVKEDGAQLITYDSFASAKEELTSIEEYVLPSLIASLSCEFSSDNHHGRIKPVLREVFGKTAGGVTVHDIRIRLNANLSALMHQPTAFVDQAADRTVKLAKRIRPKVSRFLHLAHQETDSLKQFLYFFLSIEIETHASFASIDHSANISRLLTTESRIQSTSADFFEAQRKHWTNLYDRFAWCAICVWTRITDEDVTEFKRLKKIRDDIAHGSISAPDIAAVSAAEKLALKLQRYGSRP